MGTTFRVVPISFPSGAASANASVILAVPSVVIPKERNYLINPKHSHFAELKIEKPTDFFFDPRMCA